MMEITPLNPPYLKGEIQWEILRFPSLCSGLGLTRMITKKGLESHLFPLSLRGAIAPKQSRGESPAQQAKDPSDISR
jgi:hypothetical protein